MILYVELTAAAARRISADALRLDRLTTGMIG